MNKKRLFSYFGSMHWLHWLVILLSLILTLFAWYITQKQVDAKRLSQFNRESLQVIELIQERMSQYEDALWAGVSLIKSNHDSVSYSQWKVYVDNLNVLEKHPGVNGIGVIYRVYPNKLQQFLETQRLTRPSFKIHPRHSNTIYMPITYIIPVKGNEKAVGLDMAHETNRYTAAVKAMNSGLAQITGPITLVQDSEKTPGFLFYAPFYQGGPYQTEKMRRKYFLGLVYAPFIVKKLMIGALSKEGRNVAIKLSDGKVVLYNELVKSNKEYYANSKFHLVKKIKMYGRPWTFTIQGSKSFNTLITSSQPITILCFGLLIDLLLLILFMVLSHANKKALIYVEQATKELQDKNSKLTRLTKYLQKIAHFDSLTQLPNRYSFVEYLEHSIARAKRMNTIMAVCFIDLDDFKKINDSVGHHVGDALLKEIATILSPVLRDVDYLARLSGDEFAVIIEQVDSPTNVRGIVEKYIEVFKKPITYDNRQSTITASIGIALYPTGGSSVEELIKHADIAMYRSKELGKNTFQFFNKETNKQVQRQHQISNALQTAIENNELELVYQPQLDIRNNKIIGVEALLRWHSAALGVVSPDEFIPIAESSSIIYEIGAWIFEQIGKDYLDVQVYTKNLNFSINISIRQLEEKDFSNQVKRLLLQHSIDAKNITLEVTETAAMKNPESIIKLMMYLSNFNICFALDDFGIGYSSMGYLKRMPISFIKIDKSFVGDIESDLSDAAIVGAIIQLSKAINVKTVAEGVETKGQLDFLKQNGCDFVQGYYFYKPMKLGDLIKLFQNQKNGEKDS